jgi:hypothetical protein
MRLVILALVSVIAASCAKNSLDIKNFNMHMFSDDVSFVERNLKCASTYKTDEFDVVNNEIFRCSNSSGSVFLEIESDGNNSEDILRASLIWKEWYDDLNPRQSQVEARQYAAVFSKLYLNDRELEFVDSLFNDIPYTFTNIVYDVETDVSEKRLYTLRSAEVTFKKAD